MGCFLSVLGFGSRVNEQDEHDVPAASSFRNPRKAGYLDKLTGKSWLYSGSWKKRFCVLDGTKLYYYEGKESKGSERTSGVISLDYYDLCEEATPKECKRATNVFVVSTSVRGFFDVRYMFAAETLDEMKNWMIHIKAAANDARKNRSRAGRARRINRSSRKTTDGDNYPSNGSFRDSGEDGVFDVPTDVGPLPSATKDRPRGPQGRRLPHRKTLMPRDEEEKGRCRASSLSEIECTTIEDKERVYDWKTRSVELDLDGTNSHVTCVKRCLAYDYSSSEDSVQAETTVDAQDNASPKDRSLRRCLFNKTTTFSSQTPTNRATMPSGGLSLEGQETKSRNKVTSMTMVGDKDQTELLIRELEKRWSSGKDKRHSNAQKKETMPSKEIEEMTQIVDQMNTTLKDMDKDLAVTKNDLGNIHENLRNVTTDVNSTNEKVDQLTSQVQELDKQVTTLLKAQDEVKSILHEAMQERQDFLKLKQECEEMLSKINKTVSSSSENSDF